ncbi:MAG: 4a-hydroxytetrahydrobiopterin dehydratase [Planctomycetota bacterium]
MPTALPANQITAALQDLPGWAYADEKIGKAYQFNDFRQALAFIVRVGLEAETAGHHPELFNVYNRVTIHLNTHDAGGKVTQKDLDLAGAIERI